MTLEITSSRGESKVEAGGRAGEKKRGRRKMEVQKGREKKRRGK